MTKERILLGSTGEQWAVDYLRKKGLTIIERNVRNRYGEIDIIAQDKDTLCFVEVKTRTQTDQGHPLESVTRSKQGKLRRASLCYLQERNWLDRNVRFDVVAILPNSDNSPHIEFVPNAFE